jgi:co-chaperonin GroES (HSP10)
MDDDEDIKVTVDDKVLFAKYAGTEVKFDGIDYLLMVTATFWRASTDYGPKSRF